MKLKGIKEKLNDIKYRKEMKEEEKMMGIYKALDNGKSPFGKTISLEGDQDENND